MKNVLKSGLVLACALACLSNTANAATNASSTVTGNVPVLNTVQATGGSLSISVDATSGQMSGNISTGFSVFTNNSHGINVQFDAASTSATGNVNASTSTAAGSNTGKVVLANNDIKPTAASIINALSSNASADNNANTIAYKIQFTGSRQNSNPVYSSENATSANVLAPVGTTTFTAQILNDNTFLANTYDGNTMNFVCVIMSM